MLKRKTNIFVTILFTFVAFILIGTTNVNAETVGGFEVSNVTINETYGYTTATSVDIPIKNRGTNSLQIDSVTVDTSEFVVDFLDSRVTVGANATDTSYEIKAKPGLNVGNYTGTITVTDENNKEYTSTVTLKVARKPLEDISVSKDGWTYDGTAHTGYTKSGLDSVTSDKYLIEYSIKNADEWSSEIPKLAGTYTIRLTITDPNLEEKSTESDFEIEKNNTEIKIIANSYEVTYDSLTHSESGYKIYYGGTEITNRTLPTGDIISVAITGSVTDVADTFTGNNVVSSYSLVNEDCYSNITTTNGTLTVKPITTEIIVTAGSATKAYDGSALTKDSYTYTDGVLTLGDELTATIIGSQTYVGTSDNTVSNVKVMRDGEDISGNYTFGTHVDGTLTVTAIDQPLLIADQYVRVNGTLLTSELEMALTGAFGNVSFEKKSGNAGEYNNETIGGFKGSSEGTVEMTVKATTYDVNSDGTVEYNATEQDFFIYVVEKETVTFRGIPDGQQFTYTGAPKTPSVPNVTDNKVEKSTLEVTYAGTGSTTYSSSTAPKDAGTYRVTYKVPESNPTYMGQVTYNFTITKKQYPNVTISGATTFEYTGSPIRSSASGFINNLMTATGDIEKTDVGNYTITVKLNDKNNYAWIDGSSDDLELHWSITKTTPTIVISNLSQRTGSIVEPTYTVSPAVTDGTVKVEYKLSTAEDIEYTETLPTRAGTYSVRVSVTGDKNLNDKSEVATLEIKKKSTSSGGSSSTTKYEIKVTSGKGGTISPETTKVKKGDDEEFTIKVDEGYEIEDVIVDGKSVGAVKSYKFENVKEKHTIKATFNKVEEKTEEKKDEENKEDKAWENPFNDVKEDNWYYKAIEFVNQKNLFSGMSKNEFGPKVEMTRGMFVTVLSKLNGGKIEGKLEFIDVDENAYYAKPVAWAYKKRIVGGVGNEMFAPNKEITREELAVMMYNYMQKTGTDLPAMLAEFPAFDDANEISSWAENAVRVMRATGLMNGKTGNKFDPKGKATRAEVATILMNFSK